MDVSTEFYVELQPVYSQYGVNKDKVQSLKAVGVTQGRPRRDGFFIKINLEMPRDFFDIPEVNIRLHGTEAKAAVAELNSWIGKT